MKNSSGQQNSLILSLCFISGAFLGSIFTAVVFFQSLIFFALEVWSRLATIAGGISVLFAALNFFHQRQNDQIRLIIDQLGFFRSEIIPAARKIDSILDSISSDITRSRTPIENFNSTEFFRLYPDMFNVQMKFLNDKSKTKELFDQIDLLNMLEEFSLRVVNTNGIDHHALLSVRNVFLSIVEKNALAIINLSTENTNGWYPGVRELYTKWVSLK